MENPKLNFYTRPFKEDKYSGWVRDAKGNFVFEFEDEFDEKGNYAEGCQELKSQIILSLNDLDRNFVPGLKLKAQDGVEIIKEGKLFILIRGWGNLTGVGAHNFSGEKASKIQDDFVKWFLWKVCENSEEK